LGVVDKYHGDVIKFCGDAVIILWPINDDASETLKSKCIQLASVCALHLLADCGEYDRGEGESAVSLRLHCGISSGLVHCMCLGEGDRWEFLISGNPLQQVGKAEAEANLGEVCLSQEAYNYVQNIFQCENMPLGSRRLTGQLNLKTDEDETAAQMITNTLMKSPSIKKLMQSKPSVS
jgi:class 3 adenylate cyclase